MSRNDSSSLEPLSYLIRRPGSLVGTFFQAIENNILHIRLNWGSRFELEDGPYHERSVSSFVLTFFSQGFDL